VAPADGKVGRWLGRRHWHRHVAACELAAEGEYERSSAGKEDQSAVRQKRCGHWFVPLLRYVVACWAEGLALGYGFNSGGISRVVAVLV
jgi:hypothetical protein